MKAKISIYKEQNMSIKQMVKNLLAKIGSAIGYHINITKIEYCGYKDFSEESLKNKLFYNIGAAGFKHKYWTNIDYGTEHYKGRQQHEFIEYNLMDIKPLPLESNTAEIIYTSHTIEHVSDEAVLNMFKESYRVLKKGGGIRITAPDARRIYQDYQRGIAKYYQGLNSPMWKYSEAQLFLSVVAGTSSEIYNDGKRKKFSDDEIANIVANKTYEEAMNIFCKECSFDANNPGQHINWWDNEKTESFLKQAGFKNIYHEYPSKSRFAPLRDKYTFDKMIPLYSFFVEAIK